MFTRIYFVGLLLMFSMRLWYRWRARHEQVAVSRKTTLEYTLLGLGFVGMVLIPLTHVFTPLLSFADHQLPAWAGWVGTGIFLSAMWLLWRTHHDLGKNWSQTLEIRKGHQLITSGVYRYVRHPMYAAFLLWGLAQPLLLHNWIAGWSHLVAFLPLYILRVPREEQMMREQFGEAYQAYMAETGRVIPRFIRKQSLQQRTRR